MRFCFLLILILSALPLVGDDACPLAAVSDVRGQPDIPAHDDADKEDVAIFKGRVELLVAGHYRLVGCEADSWSSCEDVTPPELGVTDLQMVVWATHNTTLLIYGKWDDSPLAANCFLNVEDVKVTTGCEEVPNVSLSWGTMKSFYR